MNSHRLEATATARRWLEQNALFLDTETSGLHAGAEIVEITLIDSSGEAVLDTLVRPERPIPPALTRIHGIDNRMVADAPRWPQLHERLLDIIEGRPVVIYNADFDLRMLAQVAQRHALPWPDGRTAPRRLDPPGKRHRHPLRHARIRQVPRRMG